MIFLKSAPSQIIELSPHLTRSLFFLDRYSFVEALPLGRKDWPIIDQLRRTTSSPVEDNYFRLVVDYAANNLRRLENLRAADLNVSKFLISGETEKAIEEFNNIDTIDNQSVFAFKLFSSLNAHSHDRITEYFGGIMHSSWVRKRFLYPMVYYYINGPESAQFEQTLGQQFPGDKSNSERAIVRLLLSPDTAQHETFAFKCYVALMCHPYDAVEIIADHFEAKIARKEKISAAHLSLLNELSALAPRSRLETIITFASSGDLKFSNCINTLPVCTDLGLDTHHSKQLHECFSAKPCEFNASGTSFLSQILRMRSNRYPTIDDWTDITQTSRTYSFATIGRLFECIMAGLYMWERKDCASEMRILIRQYHFVGAITAFSLTSPRGYEALVGGLYGELGGSKVASIEAAVNEHFVKYATDDNRWWIKQFHWDQRSAEYNMQIVQWMSAVRDKIPLSYNYRYLSGIDWTFVDNIIDAFRIGPFIQNPNGIYVLLLRFLEQRQRGSSSLRLSLKPIALKHSTLLSFVEWLISQFGKHSIAFVRCFLTPDTILHMKLESNYTAALTERLTALERLVKNYGFDDDILTEDQIEQEHKAVTAALTLMSVAAHQFEVSWDTLKKDSTDNGEDFYKAYLAFRKTYNSVPLLTESRKKAPHIFSNRQVQNYDFANKHWPLVSVICSIIDTFLSHPSSGIEAILAVRIRHDNFRREFSIAIDGLKRTSLPGMAAHDKRRLLPEFEQPVYSVIQSWIDRYMHTGRMAPDTALFDFRPTQADMENFISAIGEDATFEQIADVVIQWLNRKLDDRLHTARRLLIDELKPALEETIDEVQHNLIVQHQASNNIAFRIAAAVQQTVSQKADALREWFRAPRLQRNASMSYEDLLLAVEGRFRFEVERGKLKVSTTKDRFFERSIAPENIRHVFDMCSEATLNAMKYSDREMAYVRITPFYEDDTFGLVFSSLRNGDAGKPQCVEGHHYETMTERVFKSGNSGLEKMAHLAASVARKPVKIRIFRRRRGFHVMVPLGCMTTECEASNVKL